MSETSVDEFELDANFNAGEAFAEHLRRKATEARLRYGLYIDAQAIVRMLDDRAVVRYPASVLFDSTALLPGEFAYARPLGFHPSDGFCLLIHPRYESQPDLWPLLFAYHIPSINYGDLAEPEHAELFGATLLGLEVETYYDALCELADGVADVIAPDSSRGCESQMQGIGIQCSCKAVRKEH